MNLDQYISYITKELSGEISADEKKVLIQWLEKDNANRIVYEEMKSIWDVSDVYSEKIDIDLKNSFQSVQTKIDSAISPSVNTTLPFGFSIRSWMKIAASVFILLSCVGYLYFNDSKNFQLTEHIVADLKEISLPDNSKFIMSSGGSLIYDERFGEREVTFDGTATVEITKNAERPFVIHTPKSTITVLGTGFILNDNKDEEVAYLQMLNGKLRIKVNGQTIILENNEGIYFNTNGFISESKTIVAHKHLKNHQIVLNYHDDSIKRVIKDLETLYEIPVNLDNKFEKCKFSGKMTPLSVENALEIISKTYNATFSKSNNNEYFLKGGCD